jgi:hypothetical protein
MRSTTLMHLRIELPMIVWSARQANRRQHLPVSIRVLAAKVREGIVMDVAWALPRPVAYWAFIRVMAAATQHPDGRHQHPDEVTYSQASTRWTDP